MYPYDTITKYKYSAVFDLSGGWGYPPLARVIHITTAGNNIPVGMLLSLALRRNNCLAHFLWIREGRHMAMDK